MCAIIRANPEAALPVRWLEPVLHGGQCCMRMPTALAVPAEVSPVLRGRESVPSAVGQIGQYVPAGTFMGAGKHGEWEASIESSTPADWPEPAFCVLQSLCWERLGCVLSKVSCPQGRPGFCPAIAREQRLGATACGGSAGETGASVPLLGRPGDYRRGCANGPDSTRPSTCRRFGWQPRQASGHTRAPLGVQSPKGTTVNKSRPECEAPRQAQRSKSASASSSKLSSSLSSP